MMCPWNPGRLGRNGVASLPCTTGDRPAEAEATGVHRIPNEVHADRGTSLTSEPVAQLLLDLGVDRSHSRPHVSSDNPDSTTPPLSQVATTTDCVQGVSGARTRRRCVSSSATKYVPDKMRSAGSAD